MLRSMRNAARCGCSHQSERRQSKVNPSREVEIVWVRDISELEFVREGVAGRCHRTGKIASSPVRDVVGWANVKKEGPFPDTVYGRRFWFLKSYDLDPEVQAYPSRYPAEAVDPKSIELNRKSQPMTGTRGK
jgi:hypothetical protein